MSQTSLNNNAQHISHQKFFREGIYRVTNQKGMQYPQEITSNVKFFRFYVL